MVFYVLGFGFKCSVVCLLFNGIFESRDVCGYSFRIRCSRVVRFTVFRLFLVLDFFLNEVLKGSVIFEIGKGVWVWIKWLWGF